MTLSSAIDTLCAYFNTLASFFSTLQRLKNEFHTGNLDYAALVIRFIQQPNVDPTEIGDEVDLQQDEDQPGDFEHILLSALVALAVYHPGNAEDWTTHLTPIIRRHTNTVTRPHKTPIDPWKRGKLRPVVIDLHEAHYMTSSKPHVYLATYLPQDTVVLSLPGTNSPADWLSNLHSATADFPYDDASASTTSQGQTTIKVHQGFLYIAQCLLTHRRIVTYLRAAMAAGIKKVLLTGHSQAGAVVSLLAILLESRFDLTSRVVTFGSAACVRQADFCRGTCSSFIRCLSVPGRQTRQTHTSTQGATATTTNTTTTGTWQVDPVPFLDDTLLSAEQGEGTMYPMGTLYVLLHGQSTAAPPEGRCVSARRLAGAGDLAPLLRTVLMDFSAEPHAMKGYLRAILAHARNASLTTATKEDLSDETYFALTGEYHNNNDDDDDDDVIARSQLIRHDLDEDHEK